MNVAISKKTVMADTISAAGDPPLGQVWHSKDWVFFAVRPRLLVDEGVYDQQNASLDY